MGFADLVAAADRAVLGHLGGVDVTYAPSVGSPVTIKGIIDEASFGIPDLAGPAVFIRSEDLPGDPELNALVTIAAKTYRVRAVEPEAQASGLGGIRLWLVAT